MIDPSQLLKEIIRPVLKGLDLWSEAAECIVLGTACVESECGRWVRQLGGGPALSIFQEEPATHDDIWLNYLAFRPDLARKVRLLMINSENPMAEEMVGNLLYATAMCRIQYYRFLEPLPGYLRGQAEYWKKYYNTKAGKAVDVIRPDGTREVFYEAGKERVGKKGTPQKYIDAWNRFVEPGTA